MGYARQVHQKIVGFSVSGVIRHNLEMVPRKYFAGSLVSKGAVDPLFVVVIDVIFHSLLAIIIVMEPVLHHLLSG